jgi:hypothetical protein
MWWRLGIALAFAWALLMPPLFTGGACTAEFEAESNRIDADRAALSDPARAAAYWGKRAIAYYNLSKETCRRARPRFLADCGDGPLVYARVPVANPVCRIYRDDSILVQLQYDARNRLARTQVDMAPFKSLPIPHTRWVIDWAR